MKRTAILTLILLAALAAPARNARDTLGVGVMAAFTENLGQWDARVRFEAQLHAGALFLEDDGLTVVLSEELPHPAPGLRRRPRGAFYRMRFADCQPAALLPQGRQEGYSNYLLGNDPSRWRTRVSSYAAVTYRDLYPGIDLEVYSANRALKYNWIVSPGADPGRIAIDYIGARDVRVNRQGDLVVHTALRDIVEVRPYAYQEDRGHRREVAARYVAESGKEGFRVTLALGDYDRSLPLVVDPMLIFSTYTGSTADNWGTTAAYDSKKNVYTAGLVFAQGYPVSDTGYDTTFNGTCDIGIFKFDSVGSQRLWATYLGGAQADMPHSLFVNHFDELLIFGTTGSDDFPVSADAFQTDFAGGQHINYESSAIPFPQGSDIFVARLTEDGALGAATYVGGSGNDGLNYRHYFNNNYNTIMFGNDSLYYNYGDGARGEIVTDNLGNIYLGSTTHSTDFPVTPGCVQAQSGGGQDGVLLKLDHNLRNLVWSTYLGGSGDDAIYSVDVDADYNPVVCGGTNSADFPVSPAALMPSYEGGPADGFVAKLAYGGERIMAATFFGSDAYDQLYFAHVGTGGDIFVFGQTKAAGSTLIANAGYSVPGSGMLLARLAPDLASRRWSTVFGTPGRVNLSPTAFTADICNRIYAVGWGRDFVGYNGIQWYTLGTTGMEVTPDAYSDSTDGQDFYILSLDADADELRYATFFGELHAAGYTRGGGDHVDGGTSRFDRLATLYQSVCASCGGTNAFPVTASAWSDSNRASNCNNALFRFNVANDFPVAEFQAPPAGCAPYTVQFSNLGRGTAFEWDFGDGTTSTLAAPSHVFTAPGTYTVTLVATLAGGCAAADTQRHTLLVLAPSGHRHQPLIACNGAALQIGLQPQLGASYAWQGQVSDPSVANPWVTQAGTYILATSASGCTQTDTFQVTTYTLVDSLAVTPPRCRDSADARLTLLLGPGMNPDSVSLVLTVDGLPRPMAAPDARLRTADSLPASAWLTLEVDAYGCHHSEALRVPNPAPRPYAKQTSKPLCLDTCAGWVLIQPLSTPGTDTLIAGLCPGTHRFVLDDGGCPLIDTTDIVVDHRLDQLAAWADPAAIILGQSTTLHAAPTDGLAFSWEPAATVDDPAQPVTAATPADTLTTYTLTATSTASGCTATAEVTVIAKRIVCPEPDQVIPNAFTPNGDGRNDRLAFRTENISDFSFALFNRWGQKVFETDDPNATWDGTYHSQPCPAGVFTYTCRYTCVSGEQHDAKGDITLIR